MSVDFENEEESEDESFKDDNEGSNDDEESDENEQESGSDVDMIDEELDKKELKSLQKEVGDIDYTGGRPKRGQRK